MEFWSDVLTRITPFQFALRWGKPCPAFTAGLDFAVVTRW